MQQQEKVQSYFQERSRFWKNIYAGDGVFAETIRDRQAAALHWIDGLELPAGARTLEVGCGAGFLAVALAQRGLRVRAIDAAEAMIEQALQHAAEAGVAEQLSLHVGNVYELVEADESFDLVVALGVIPWLEQPERAIEEMARVTKSGGYLILTTANRAGLTNLLDPLLNPALAPLRLYIKTVLVRLGLRRSAMNQSPGMQYHTRRYIDMLLARAGFVKIESMTRGFVFSFLRHRVRPIVLAVVLHRRFQWLVDRNLPLFRAMGMAYFVLARKNTAIHE
jgi:ubiquinone/menaquinone biosynthesis C-methylase UbiE